MKKDMNGIGGYGDNWKNYENNGIPIIEDKIKYFKNVLVEAENGIRPATNKAAVIQVLINLDFIKKHHDQKILREKRIIERY